MDVNEQKHRNKSEEMHVAQVRFLSEQDGMDERELKKLYIRYFEQNDVVYKAYLVRVDYGLGTQVKVALCIRTTFNPSPQFMQGIANLFAAEFGINNSLDIILLNIVQEGALMHMCQPFYSRPENSNQ